MKKLLLITILICTSLMCSCQTEDVFEEIQITQGNIQESDKIGLKIEKYMDQNSLGVSVQGADCYNNYLFQFQHANASVFVYDLKEQEFICNIKLNAKAQNHCNNVSFSRLFYSEEDEFPLLYVSGSQNGKYNNLQVYRIKKDNSYFFFEQIQEIIFPEANSENNLYWTDVMIDPNNQYLFVSSATNDGNGKITIFEIPNPYKEQVTLLNEDIKRSFIVGKFTHHQGANIKDNLLYIFDGVPAWGDINYLRIIDLEKEKDICKINITKKGFTYEAEGAFFYNEVLFCATNNSGIYKINMK